MTFFLLRDGDEDLELEHLLVFLGDSRGYVGGLFVLAIVKQLKEDKVFEKRSRRVFNIPVEYIKV